MNNKNSNSIDAESLSSKTGKSLGWQFGATIIESILHFVVGILLARLLPPKDFGLVALALIIVGFTQILSNVGFAPAIIQRRPLSEKHIQTAFSSSVLFGSIITICLYFLSPYSVLLFDNSELPKVLSVLALSFTINGIGSTALSLLQRRLNFRLHFYIELCGHVVNYPVAIVLALNGFGVWSLIIGTLLGQVTKNITALLIVRHTVIPKIHIREFKDLINFGFGASLNMVMNYSATHGDNFIVGRVLGASSLGLYNRAYNLMNVPLRFVSGVLGKVLFPAFSEVQDDKKRFKQIYLETTLLVGVVAAPIMSGIMIATPEMIVGLYGAKWAGAIEPLRILTLSGYFRSLYHIGGAVSHAGDRVYSEMHRQTIYATCIITLGYIGSFYGIEGVAVGISISIIIMYLLIAHLTNEIISCTWSEYFSFQKYGIILSIWVILFASFTKFLIIPLLPINEIVAFIILFCACSVGYILGLYYIKRDEKLKSVFNRMVGFTDSLNGNYAIILRKLLWV